MANWILIILLVIIVFLFLKIKETRHRIGLVVLSLILIFLAVTAFHIYTTNKLNLQSYDDIIKGGKLYIKWLGTLFSNLKQITGMATKMNWGLNNTAVQNLSATK